MNDVELSATVTVDHENLRVTSTIKNHGSVPIIVFDVTDGGAVENSFAEVSYLEPDVVVLSSKLTVPPRYILWTAPPLVYGYKVMPGEERQIARVQSLPLRTTPEPFAKPADLQLPGCPDPKPKRKPRAVTCHTLRIVLGYVSDDSKLFANPAPLVGHPIYEEYLVSAAAHQQVLVAEITNISVPVVD